jgi:hypothetical protein
MLISNKKHTTLTFFTKLLTNNIESPTPLTKWFYCLCMSIKNNLSFNNLGCQTYTSKLYNLNYNSDYIIYKVKQIGLMLVPTETEILWNLHHMPL